MKKVELIESYQTPPELPAVIKSKADNANGFLLVNHGIMMAGPDLRTALLRVEDYELLCRAALDAETIGGTKTIEPSKLDWLANLHSKTFPR